MAWKRGLVVPGFGLFDWDLGLGTLPDLRGMAKFSSIARRQILEVRKLRKRDGIETVWLNRPLSPLQLSLLLARKRVHLDLTSNLPWKQRTLPRLGHFVCGVAHDDVSDLLPVLVHAQVEQFVEINLLFFLHYLNNVIMIQY